MPKKRAPTYNTKPKSPAHPSLSSSGKSKDAHSLVSRSATSGNSVNDRIQQLRISHGASTSGRSVPNILNPNTNPSLPPSLRDILQFEDAPPPRPRPGLRVTGRMRGLAGPIPPSWLRRNERRDESGAGRRVRTRDVDEEEKSFGLEPLPGSFIPKDGSLVATTLKGLAEDWAWHTVYDQFYLAKLPVRYKEVLLYYLSRYNPHSLDKTGLDLLLLDETELEDGTGADGLLRLDLSTSIRNPLRLGELKEFFTARKSIATTKEEKDKAVIDSWDTPEPVATLSALPRFHNLTHLSLSQPSGVSIWRGLLDLAPHLTTLTHLALAYWPTPSLSPNSNTAYRETPQGNVNYGSSHFYSAHDNDWSEAARLLRKLGKSTYCLQWLDLTGCYPWVQALASEHIDWCGAWHSLATIKIGQGWVPECFQEGADDSTWRDWHREARLLLPTPRSTALKEWADIEHDTLQIHDRVNARIMRAIREAQSRDMSSQPQQIEADWSDGPSEGSKPAWRSTRLVFERGWDAWWIREAIEQLVK